MYDLIIIGGGAAGTAAGVYAARRGLNFKIVAKEFGGEVATSGEIGNWPGVNQTNGVALAKQFRDHLNFYKVGIEEGVEVEKITKDSEGVFCITARRPDVPPKASEKLLDPAIFGQPCEYAARTVLVATGGHPKELGVPGEKEYRNKGVSYCTTCDGPLFAGKAVAVIGGGNSALESALMLADIAAKVFVINKNPKFKGDEILVQKISSKNNVEIIYNARTTKILGEKFVNGLTHNDQEGNEKKLGVEGIFVHIGMAPNSQIIPENTEKNQYSEIVVNKNCETNVSGLYAAGDVTDVPFKQIVIAAGQGCVAVLSAAQYLNKLSK